MDYKSLIAPPDFKAHWNETIKTPEYHSDRKAVNSSSLKKIIKSPLAFHDAFYGKPKEPTDSMKFGTLAHLVLLQGNIFRDRYVVMPEFESKTADGKPSESKNTKYYKDQVEQWKKTLNPDAIVVTQEERESLFGVIDAIVNYKRAANLLKNGKPEICGYWRDDQTGILCRMQADFVSFDGDTLVDVKTVADLEIFEKSIASYDYPFQMAMYAEGIKNITGKRPKTLVWLAVENKAPFECKVLLVPPEYEEAGNFRYRFAMDKLKKCIDEGKFGGAQDEVEYAKSKDWYIKQCQEMGAIL